MLLETGSRRGLAEALGVPRSRVDSWAPGRSRRLGPARAVDEPDRRGEPVIPLLLVLALAVLFAAWLRHVIRRHGPGPLLWRWRSGHTLDGMHRTNATWTKHSRGARAVLHPTGHDIWWHHQPRLYRAGIRCGAELVAASVLYSLWVHTVITLIILAIPVTAGLVLAIWHGMHTVRGRQHERDYVRPLEARADARGRPRPGAGGDRAGRQRGSGLSS